MRLKDLKPGDAFELEDKPYEVELVGERIVVAYLIGPKKSRPGIYPSAYRIPDPNDLTGDVYLTTAFSDLRFNREHETDEDRELDALL